MAKFVPEGLGFWSKDTVSYGYTAITGTSAEDFPDPAQGEWEKAGIYNIRTIYIINTGDTNKVKVKIALKPLVSDDDTIILTDVNGKVWDGSDASLDIAKATGAIVSIPYLCQEIHVYVKDGVSGSHSTFKIIPVGWRS